MTEPKRHVYIAFPSKSGMAPIEAHHCYVDCSNGIVSIGGTATWSVVQHNPYIQHVRNRLVADFLSRPDCTDLLFIDDDISWEPGAVARLLSHDLDVVGGVYPMRSDQVEFPTQPVEGAVPDQDGLLEVEYLPTGFMAIKRHVLEKMVDRYPELLYNEGAAGSSQACHALFWLELHPDPDFPGKLKMMGEDVSFCRKWIAMGGKCYADTVLAFRHHGMKAWHSRYAEHIGFLRRNGEPVDEKFDAVA